MLLFPPPPWQSDAPLTERERERERERHRDTETQRKRKGERFSFH